MSKARIIVAVLVVLSVVLPPMAGNMAFATTHASPSEGVGVSASHDCCDSDGMPAGDPMANCQAAAGCAAKCFSMYCPVDSAISFEKVLPHIALAFMAESLLSQSAIPLFRPPRT